MLSGSRDPDAEALRYLNGIPRLSLGMTVTSSTPSSVCGSVCSHALLAVPVIPRLLVWKAPTSADALVGTSSLNSSPVGLIIQRDFVFRGQFARPARSLETLRVLSWQSGT